MSASVAEQPYAPRLALCSDCERNLSPPTATGLDLFLIRPAVGTALAQPAGARRSRVRSRGGPDGSI